MLRDALESKNYVAAINVVKELLSLDLEEIKAGKKEPKKKKVKPGLNVFMPEVNE